MRAAVLALALVACNRYEKDLRIICDAPTVVGTSSDDRSEIALRIASHIQENVKTAEAIRFLESLATVSEPDEKRKLLATEAAKYGIAPCALAEMDQNAPEDSFADDVRMMCDAPNLAAIAKVEASTAAGRELVAALGDTSFTEFARLDMLQRQAAVLGIECGVGSK